MTRRLSRAAQQLLAARRVVIAGHVNPDGDTLGCVLALAHVLRKLGKNVVALSSDGVPDIYRWMPGSAEIARTTHRRQFDVAVVCDAGSLARIGSQSRAAVHLAPCLIDIDHHFSEGAFGDIRLIDVAAAAAAELVWKLIGALSRMSGSALMDQTVATCVLTGIITDTGSFRFLNVTPYTFTLAARLQRLGARPAEISELVFENRSYASLKLLGRALGSLETCLQGRVAWATVTAKDFADVAGEDEETEGIVSHVRAVRGAQVGILFREVPRAKIRISLRARDGADVCRIAAVFGGGGHKLASGCSLAVPLVEAERLVLAETTRQLTGDHR